MKKYLLLALMPLTTLGAFSFWGGCFDIGADALYWKPGHCQVTYAQGTEVTANDDRVHINQVTVSYDWGVRPYVRYTRGCSFLTASYLWFESSDSSEIRGSVTPTLFINNQPLSQFVRASLAFRYQNFDLRFGRFLQDREGAKFYVFVNGRWFQSDRDLRSKIFEPNTAASRFRRDDELAGGALGVGIGAQYCVWYGINVFGELNPLAWVGERKAIHFDETAPVTGRLTDFRLPTQTSLGYGFDLRIGLNYAWCFCNVTTTFDIGYQLDTYLDAYGADIRSQVTNPIRGCDNASYGGPFFGASVRY